MPAYEGTGPNAGNPVLGQLISNLAPGQTPIVRIGGDSTDWAWWPVPGVKRPPGIHIDLSSSWVQSARALAQSSGARLIVGINLEADNPEITTFEARRLLAGIGRPSIEALEIGNEPQLYPILPWYHTAKGSPEFGRPPTYDLADYQQEFTKVAAALPRVPLAGPSIGHSWLSQLKPFIATAPGLSLVTFHAYAIDRYGAAFRGRNCSTPTSDPAHPSIATLLNPFASVGLERGLAPDIALAHQRGIDFRIDEMNAITCAGTPGVSDTFASALWALNTLYAMASAGVDGVNIHTWRGSAGKLFGFSRTGGQWTGSVRPEYYGLLMFARAVPAGSQLLTTIQTAENAVQAWASVGPDHETRVVLINDSLTSSRSVLVRIPADRAPSGPAQLQFLEAPSAAATSGVTLAGQTFGPQTSTGTLPGTPETESVPPAGGGYAVDLPASSAALLTIS